MKTKTNKKLSRTGASRVAKNNFRLLKITRILLPLLLLAFAIGGFIVWRSKAQSTLTNPTHFADVYQRFSGTNPSDKVTTIGHVIAGEITITSEPAPSVPYRPDGYFQAINAWMGDGSAAYIGFQNEGRFMTSNIYGKRVIFSMWGNCSGIESSGYAGKYGHEGSGCQTGIAYNWRVGVKYIVRMVRESCSSEACTWRGEVTDSSNNATTRVGRIRNPHQGFNLNHGIAYFHERYSGPTSSCNLLQKSSVVFGNPVTIDPRGQWRSGLTPSITRPGVCTGNSWTAVSGTTTTSVIGSPPGSK